MELRAVRALLHRPGQYLLAQHNNRLPENQGKWGLPGGRLELGDRDPEAALRREMLEEFALVLGPLSFVGDWTHKRGTHRVFAAAVDGEIARWDPAEILAVRWCSAGEVADLEAEGLLHTGFEPAAIVAWQRRTAGELPRKEVAP